MAHGSFCGWRFLLLTSSTKAMSHTVALPFTLKSKYLSKAKEELRKLKYFTMQK
jgi:hypothetical protein